MSEIKNKSNKKIVKNKQELSPNLVDNLDNKLNNDSDDDDFLFSNKNDKKLNNRYGLISDSESDSDSESILKSKLEKKIEENVVITNTKIQIEQKLININEEDIKQTQINKSDKNKLKKNKSDKNKYNFDLKKSQEKNNLSNNSIVTLFSEKIEIIIGGKKLINESDIAINSGTKYFVLGQNGIGKTSLLKYIYSKIESRLDVLMIEQDIQIESTTQKISEFIMCADISLYNGYKKMNELEKIEEMNNNELDEYNKLSELLYAKEWDKYVAESKRIIDGLGFINSDLPVSILSGGKRMILALAQALLRKPDILILDEPTNHLDLNVVIWLTNYLESYKKTLIIITHQIGLVNSLSNNIWYIGNPELIGNKVYNIKGNYNNLLKFLEQINKETLKDWEKFDKRVENLKKKSISKKEIEEFIKKEGKPRPPKPYIVKMVFDNVNEINLKNIIEFQDVSFNYSDTYPVYKNLNISLNMKSRMILVGPNGCGKTTFFKLINKSLKPTNGVIISDDRIRIGYYNQQIIENLPLELNSIQYLQNLDSKLDINMCRNILGKLGIKKIENLDLPLNKIKDLSGGQKARVSFASVQMFNPHLILLDEPTNHLDLESIEGLIKGINEFNGGIVVITHDIYLIESIENANIYQVLNNNIIKFQGEFEDYCNKIYSEYSP